MLALPNLVAAGSSQYLEELANTSGSPTGVGCIAASPARSPRAWKNILLVGIVYQRTALAKLLANTCNRFIKKMKLVGKYDDKMDFLSISFICCCLEVFVEGKRSLAMSGSTA